ncbi:myb-like protein D [Aphidius gifuensis]|uniref:myb-like protein D n=1 Tax=Aphidius gifuensis TaxID=684658 RepID=UPI001CDC5868|nr:myb-like protein D [Aphidius gifuensis]
MAQFDKHQLETSDQELFTDSFNFCWELLKSKEYYLSERETDIFSKMSLNYGQDMYDAMMIIINKIIKSNEHKSKVESTEIITAEATCDSGYDDNCDQLDQQQKQQQVDKVNIDIDNSQDKMILEKRKISVDEIHSKKMFKEDNKNNNCDDSSNAENIQIEKKLFTKDNITTKDEIVSDDLIDVKKINNSNDHSYALDIKSNEISNFSKDNNQSYSNEVIESVGYQINTRIRTGSLALKKYSFHTEEDDDLSFTTDENYLDNDDNVVTAEATCDSGYDDNCDQLDQQQKQQQVDKVNIDIDNSQDKMILEKRKISVDEVHSKKMFKEENPNWSLDLLRERSGCGDIRHRRQVEVWKEHIERGGTLRQKMNVEEKLFTEQSITIKDEMLPVTDDSIDVDKINNSHDHSIGLGMKSNESSNSFNNNDQSCSNKVIDNVDHKKNTRISTGSLVPKKYSFSTEEDDELSSTADENDLDDNNIDLCNVA